MRFVTRVTRCASRSRWARRWPARRRRRSCNRFRRKARSRACARRARASRRRWCRSAIRASSIRSTSTAPNEGKGRWADMKNWVYDFDHDLPAGVRCSFTLKAGLTALDGKPLRGRPALRVQHRRSRDPAQPAVRGREHRREPGRSSSVSTPRRRRKPSPPTRTAWPPASTSASACAWSPATSAGRSSTTASRSRRATCACCCSTAAPAARARSRSGCRSPAATTTNSARLRDAPDSPLVTLACARTLPQTSR